MLPRDVVAWRHVGSEIVKVVTVRRVYAMTWLGLGSGLGL